MRLLTVVLVVLLVLVHAELWFGKSGMSHLLERRTELAQLTAANQAAKDRNDRLQAEVSDLKEGLEMVEEKARGDLGMIKPDEMLVVVTHPAGRAAVATPAPAPAPAIPSVASR
jgi:cell division protein FtsB